MVSGMIEAPNSVFLAGEFLVILDGSSVGDIVLTQLMLGLDRGNGLVGGEGGLEVRMMAEAPNSVFLVGEFLVIFGGPSVGSIDLTQLMLGLDRGSGLVGGWGSLKVSVMTGTPSSVFLLGEFPGVFGGSAVGSSVLRSSCSASAATSAWWAAGAASR